MLYKNLFACSCNIPQFYFPIASNKIDLNEGNKTRKHQHTLFGLHILALDGWHNQRWSRKLCALIQFPFSGHLALDEHDS